MAYVKLSNKFNEFLAQNSVADFDVRDHPIIGEILTTDFGALSLDEVRQKYGEFKKASKSVFSGEVHQEFCQQLDLLLSQQTS